MNYFTIKKIIRNQLSSFFTKGHERTLLIKKNIILSVFIKSISIIINLVLVPLTINYVNTEQYGIWITLSSVVLWLSFFDIGFANGLRNKFTETKAKKNILETKIYISTTYAVLIFIFTILFLSFFLLNNFLDWTKILNTPDYMSIELSKLAIILIFFFCLQMILKTISTILIADQKSAYASFLDMLGLVFSLIFIYILTKTTNGNLLYLGISLSLSPIIIFFISTIWLFNTIYKEYKPSIKLIRISYLKNILNIGLKFFIIQIAVIVLYQSTNVIIAHTCNLKDVTIYNIVYKYFGVSFMIFNIIITPFWSAFTEAYFKNDYEWMNTTYKKLRKTFFIAAFFLIFMLLISKLSYNAWIGNSIDIKYTISIVVALYTLTNIWNSLHSFILNGIGKINLQFWISIIGTIFNIPLAYLLGKKYGIEGIVLSSILFNLISSVYAPIQIKKILNKNAKGIWNK